jgi:hypothetical protein
MWREGKQYLLTSPTTHAARGNSQLRESVVSWFSPFVLDATIVCWYYIMYEAMMKGTWIDSQGEKNKRAYSHIDESSINMLKY